MSAGDYNLIPTRATYTHTNSIAEQTLLVPVIDQNDVYNDATPAVGVDTLASILGPFVVANGLDIIETVGAADLTAGNIYYVCLWRPLSDDGFVQAAV